MNFCPHCGVDLRKIQEAIEKEKEIWRPWDNPCPYTTTYPPYGTGGTGTTACDYIIKYLDTDSTNA